MNIAQAIALTLGAVACWCDMRTRRIPNALTFGGAALGIVYSLVASGPAGLATSLGGWFTGLALFMPMFLLGGMRAGDGKVAAFLGAWLGPTTTLFVALYSALAGGIMAVAVAL